MSHGVRSTIALCALACTWAVACLAEAAEPESYEVDARIERSAGRVTGEQTVRVRVEEGEREVVLWLYADRLAVPPSPMEERSWRWIFPGEIDRGGIEVSGVTVDGAAASIERTSAPEGELRGRDFAGSDLHVAIPPGPARTIALHLSFVLDVPDRFGRLGRDGHTISLAGPWYPLVVDGDAWAFHVPHHVVLSVDDGEIVTTHAHARAVDLHEHIIYLPVLVGAHVHTRTLEVDGHELEYVSTDPIYEPPSPSRHDPSGLEDLTAIDRAGLVGEAFHDVLETTHWLGLPVPHRLVVMAVPSRTELASTAPDVVLVSSRIFEIFPLDVVREFHRRAVRRAMLTWAVGPIGERFETAADRGWVDDLRSAALVDLDELRRNHMAQTPQQLLSLFAFHPAVDQLLYAPQITFEDSYFNATDEPDRFRDDPVRARFPVTRGRRVLECVRDVLDEPAMEHFVAMLARGRRSVRSALARAGVDTDALLPGWIRYASLETNYRLGTITTERTDSGFRTTVEVLRDGDERPEPVEVRVDDSAGNHASAFWDGRGERGVVVIDTPADRSSVTIDPDQRLPESAHVADGHPRRDDATDAPWRPPIFTGFALTVLSSPPYVAGLIDVALRQRYNLENTIALRLSRSGARTGGRIGYIQGLGARAHTNRRIGSLGGALGFYYVEPNFGMHNVGGYELDLQLFGGIDTRVFIQDPRQFFILSGALLVAGVFREDGTVGVTARGGISAAAMVPIGLLNAILFAGGGGFTINPVLPADRQVLGGQYALRAFGTDELLGNGALYAVVEHRVTVASDLNLNVLWAVFARELQLAWWVGGGVVFDSLDRLGNHYDARGAFEAGAGVRVHYEYGGIAPGVLAIDVGFPISRWAQPSANDVTQAPVGFYIGFDQYY